MIKKTSSKQPYGRDSEYITGAFLKSFSIEYNSGAPVFLNLLNSLQKRDKMLHKPHILSLFPNSFNKFNKTNVRYSIS